MRYLSTIFSLCMLLIAVSCTREETPQAETAKMVEVTITADTEEATRLGVEGNKTYWEVGDRITLGLVANFSTTQFATFSINSADDISSDGKRATFRGNVPTGTYYGVAAIYPAPSNPANNITLDREAADNIFMHSFTSYEYNPLPIGAGTEIPVNFSHLMHKMDLKLSLASGYQSDDLNSQDIAVEVSGKAGNQAISFPMTSTLSIRNGMLSTATSETSFIARGKSSTFSTMLFPMGTMTNVELTFGIYIDGEKRYEITKGPLANLRMSAGKSTTVNLVLSDDNSVSGGGEIVAEPITLTASKTTIKANGTESTTLSVTNDKGEDVTVQSTLYVNDTKLNGTIFSTTSAGSYTLYAERNGARSNSVTITAEEVTNTGKTIVFAEGVTLTSGWYDVNKVGAGNNGDIQMCWAASASNIIQWWQDRYVADGGKLPSTAITGAGKDHYELALMDMYHSEWDNSLGGHVEQAIPWYFEGKLNGGEYASAGTQATPKSAGGYWKSVWSSVVSNMYCGYDYFSYDTFSTAYTYTVCYNNYYLWGNGSSLTGTDRLKYYTDLVVRAFDHGMASMTVSLSSNISSLHHAVTLWGYEIDNATGLLTRVWVTDSDDLTKEPKGQILHEYTVSIGEGKSHIQLTCPSVRYGSVWVVDIVPVAGPNSNL